MEAIAISRDNEHERRIVNYFMFTSIVISILVGIGKNSMGLPLLVITSVLVAKIYVDWLKLYQFPRPIGYAGMILGACVAIFDYWNNQRNSLGYGLANLYAVGNMLVYIQIPLMFQRKDPRLFEHWGLFLVLESVIAALLNDNALFGLLLVPALSIACCTLVALAAFNTHRLGTRPAADRSGWDLLTWLGIPWLTGKQGVSSGIELGHVSASDAGQSRQRGAEPLVAGGLVSVGVIAFALVYFFCLPRIHTGAYEGLGISKPLVGFSGTVSLDDFGELMTNDSMALRMSIRDQTLQIPFQPSAPPYIRGAIADYYVGDGRWETKENTRDRSDLLESSALRGEILERGRPHLITIYEHARLGATRFSIPPFFRSNTSNNLRFDDRAWCLRNRSFFNSELQGRRSYQFESIAFQQSFQTPFLVDALDCIGEEIASGANESTPHEGYTRAFDPDRFPGLIEYRDRILASATDTSTLGKILMLEDYLAYSRDFKYSLLPQVDRESDIDPIEDFAVNHRTGHCQYFASTLAMMLRSLGHPSRLVLGFRPAEYNDVGNYFVVRQRHAHAWVEVFLAQEELKGTSIVIPEWAKRGVWLRLDPTPPVEGSNAGGTFRTTSASGQTFEAFEQFWQDSIMDFDSSQQPEVFRIFAGTGNGPLASMFRSIEMAFLQLQSQGLSSIEFSGERWFSWTGALVASLCAVLSIFAIRMRGRIPRLWRGWTLHRRRSGFSLTHAPPYRYFRRAILALERLGWYRAPHQTPLEFFDQVQAWLHQQSGTHLASEADLRLLVTAFYHMRYGEMMQFSPEQVEHLNSIVTNLEQFVATYRRERRQKRGLAVVGS